MSFCCLLYAFAPTQPTSALGVEPAKKGAIVAESLEDFEISGVLDNNLKKIVSPYLCKVRLKI